jgi:hypothetical protein
MNQPNNQPPPNYNPINVNQGFLSTLMQSLLPWYHLPQNGGAGGGANDLDDDEYEDWQEDQ